MSLISSWVDSANTAGSAFPLNNLPYGVFSVGTSAPRCGVAIGDSILDVAALEKSGLLGMELSPLCQNANWNALMALSPDHWDEFRNKFRSMVHHVQFVSIRLESLPRVVQFSHHHRLSRQLELSVPGQQYRLASIFPVVEQWHSWFEGSLTAHEHYDCCWQVSWPPERMRRESRDTH